MSNENKNGALALVPRSESTALGVSGGLTINGFAEMERAAKMLAQANGIVPRAYQNNPAAVAAVIMTGFELGIAPMTAMRELHLIEGKVSLSATLMLTLARRAGIKTRWLKTDNTVATIGVTVPGQQEQTLTFSAEDAKAAGLWGKGNWSKHPAAMLRARATSAAIRAFCPEAIGGSVYESESGELTDGAPPEPVTASVVDVTPARAHSPTTATRKRLRDVTTGDELHAWCVAERDRMTATRGDARGVAVDAVHAKAMAVKVDPAIALEWAGLHYDPESGEVPASQEPDAHQ